VISNSKKVYKKFSLSVVMPVFNEVTRVVAAISEVLAASGARDIQLIVVESGSTDGTTELLEKYKHYPNVEIIYQSKALGKGFAVREGLQRATKEIICVFDADLEYRFTDVFNVMVPIEKGETSFTLGSRWAGHSIRDFEAQTWKSTLLNILHIFGALFINFCFGIKTKDPFTMWKVFTRESIIGIDFLGNTFDWDLEVIGELAIRGHKPIEVPVTYQSRDYSQGKKIRLTKEVPILIRVVLRLFVKRIRRKLIPMKR
jgi:glycosyltransferase involved in cell wall biosynthesis